LTLNVLSPTMVAPPLHDLLGVSFVFNSAVTSLAWDRDFAFFGLADGSVAILRAHWQGAPGLAPRVGGGVEIVACSGPPPPPAIFPVHKGNVLALASDPLGGVVSGGEDGLFQRLVDGEIQTLDTKARRRIVAVAAGRGGRRACAAGRQVELRGPDARRLTMPAAVTALAYDPSGLHLAVGYVGGVSLDACGVREAPRVEVAGGVGALAWRLDGGAAAAAGPGGVWVRDRAEPVWMPVEGLPGAVVSLAFAVDGALVFGGADFAGAWRPGDGLQIFGGGLRGPVACHPRLDLLACAAADGRILLRRRNMGEAMVLREPGAAPTFLSFAPDGEALAFVAEDGEAGTVILPDLLFRSAGGG
jgi:hypothetical protein